MPSAQPHRTRLALWKRVWDAESGEPPPRLTAMGRAAFFFGFWLMISGSAIDGLPVGAAAAAAAAWTSLRLLPPGRSKVRPIALLMLILRILRQSMVSGTDVAWRALDPRLPLRPGFVAYPLHLPSGGARSAFCALSSMLPGTLPTGTDVNGALLIHCLDVSEPVAANLAAEESLFMRAAGHD